MSPPGDVLVDNELFRVREACEADVSGVKEIFLAVYGEDYPYRQFFEEHGLKHSVYNDDVAMLVVERKADSRILGTASVVFDVGSHADLVGEFGRLAVHPDGRGQRLGNLLMEGRLAVARERLHLGVVENRCAHPYSQKISTRYGFAPIGFLPLKHQLHTRESVALYGQHFGDALELRRNHPRLIPEVHPLAHLAMRNMGMKPDVIVDRDVPAYPAGERYIVRGLRTRAEPALFRIARGRLGHKEIFGPVRLQYGFFKLSARHATYLVAHHGVPNEVSHEEPLTHEVPDTPIAGAIGFIMDDVERSLRIYELLAPDDGAVHFLLEMLLERAQKRWGTAYIEVDVSAYAPRMQRTLLELGFLPVAYLPAMVFHEVERLDVVRMARLLIPPELGEVVFVPGAQEVADTVMTPFIRQAVLPRVASKIPDMALFQGLSAEQAQAVAGTCTLREFSDGDVLFAPGDPSSEVFLVLDGQIMVKTGEPLTEVGRVHQGEVLGEVSATTGEPHRGHATAVGAVCTAVIQTEDLEALIRRRPVIGVVVYRNLAAGLGSKLVRLNAWLAERD